MGIIYGDVMVKDSLTRWPFIRKILSGGDGAGVEAMSARTRSLRPRHEGAQVARSVCPYCAVGCGQLVYHRDGKLVSIEGDPDSFISRWPFCPKGSDSFELLTHANQETRVKYRRLYSTKWEELDLQTAMDMIADRLSSTVTRAEGEN
jgi:formate dehydrogenase major subunit